MVNCRNCVFKRNIAGDCHVACGNPAIVNNSTKLMLITLNGQFDLIQDLLGFTINPHGIENGWATFPVNYDPIWLDGECKLYLSKDYANEKGGLRDEQPVT